MSLCLKPVSELVTAQLLLGWVHTQTEKQVVVWPPHIPVTSPHDILQKWIIERGNWSKKKKMKNSALLCLRLFNILVRKMNIEVSITFFFKSLYHSYLLCLLSQFPNESDISDGADSLKMYIFRKICFFIIELRHIGVWKHSLRLKMQKLKFPCVQLLTCPIPWGCPTQTLLMD